MSRRVAMSAFLIALAVPSAPAAAQRLTASVFGGRGAQPSPADEPTQQGAVLIPPRLRTDSVVGPATPWAVLASAVVPGSGQALLRQDRVIAYLAVEAYAWVRYAADAREGRRARARYRTLASEVARRPFSVVRPAGDFDYYERMEQYAESGVFDVIAGGELDPEPDTSTANGATWLLARETYWSDPWTPPPRESQEYVRAETFYRDRAIRPDYRWSWTNAQLEYSEFRRTIRRSNNAYRASLQDLGLVIANHALSTVDAFITVRLRRNVVVGEQRFEAFGSIPIR
jgi:hypothetical protein